MRELSLLMVLAIGLTGWAGSAARADAAAEIAPQHNLRVALVGANPVLVTKKPDGSLGGVSIALGKYIAAKLGAAFEPVPYPSPGAYADSFGKGEWELAIGPRTPVVEQHCEISPDFMLVDNIYVAAPGKQFADASQVDRPGVRIAVAKNGAPDQYLSKTLKSAELIRLDGEAAILAALRSGAADVYGSNAENVHAAADKIAGAKILPGAFRTVHMAVAMPKGRSPAAQEKLTELVNEAKAGGLVKKALDDQRSKGVRPAP
jgi:polar amino acid transport system substrate-binding protein